MKKIVNNDKNCKRWQRFKIITKIVNNEKDCTQFISEQGWTKGGGGGAGPEVSFSAKYSHGKSKFLEMIYYVIT